MRKSAIGVALVASLVLLPQTVVAQSVSGVEASVPRVMQFTGTFRPVNGQPPAPVEIVTFAIYADETGGTALWQETQNVTVASGGDYTVILGATNPAGLPVDVFASGHAHWLGVQVNRQGESEQPRIQIMSVPYALRSADADTLGGRPASAYKLAEQPATASTSPGEKKTIGTQNTNAFTTSSATTSWIPVAVDNAGGLGNSSMFQSGSGSIGLGTTSPLDAFHVAFTDPNGAMTGLAVQNKSGGAAAYSGMLFYDQNGALGQFQGFNNSTHEYRINNIASGGSINFMLGSASRFLVTSAGNIGIGTTGPGALLDVSNALIPTSGFANVATTSYTGANPNGSRFVGRHARGAVGAPTALLNGDNLVGFVGQGYGATGFSSGRAGMFVQAAENWTDLAQGTNLIFTSTPTGTTTQLQQMSIDQTGNVGIGAAFSSGTTFAGAPLEISRTGSDALVLTTVYTDGSNTNSAYTTAFANGTPAAPTAAQTGNFLGGWVARGYGATHFGSPVGGMAVIAEENFTDTSQGVGTALLATPLGSNSLHVYAAVLPSGNVGLGDWLVPNPVPTAADKLQVFGDVRVGTTGTNGCVKNFAGTGLIGTCSSDRRLKKDITPFGSVLEQVTALQPVHFNWRVDEFPDRHFGDSRAYGLIAQDVEIVLPELVATDQDGFKAVDYSKLPLLAVQAVKELKSRNEQLSEEAAQLGARVDALERTVRELLATIAAK